MEVGWNLLYFAGGCKMRFMRFICYIYCTGVCHVNEERGILSMIIYLNTYKVRSPTSQIGIKQW